MKKPSMMVRGGAALVAAALALTGQIMPAKAATTTFTDCYLYSAGEPDFIVGTQSSAD